MFLERSFYSSVNIGKNHFCNFLIKTDIIFERYIFLLLKELIDESYTEYYIDEQVDIKYIKRVVEDAGIPQHRGHLLMIPDIVIYKKASNLPLLIIDTKYIDITNKNKLTNSAYYQVFSYVSCLYQQYGRSVELDAILLAYGNAGNNYEFRFDDNKVFNFYTEAIDLFTGEVQLKEQLRSILNRRLNS